MKDMAFTQLFPVDQKSPQCFRHKELLKTNKSNKDFNRWDPPASPAPTYGGLDTKKSVTEPRTELRPRARKGSTKQFSKKFLTDPV